MPDHRLNLLRPLTSVIAAATLLSACHPEQYRWSSELDWINHDSFNPVGVARTDGKTRDDFPSARVFSYSIKKPADPASSTADKGVQSLSDHGQQAYIESIAKASKKPTGDLQALLKKDSDGSGKGGLKFSEEDELYRTLVISIAKAVQAKPGDRLMRVVVQVTPCDNERFTGYTVPATAITLQDIAQVQNTVTTSVTGKFSPTFTGKVTGGAEGDASLSSVSQGTADIGQQYESLNLDISPDRIVVIRESERGVDLSGNVIITPITVALPENAPMDAGVLIPSTTSFFASATPLAANKISVTPALVQYALPQPVYVDVKLRYQLRVPDGDSRKYYVEGKQDVYIRSGEVDEPHQLLIPAREVSAKRYRVVHLVDEKSYGAVQITVNGIRNDAVFDDYATASSFAAWMQQKHATTLGKQGYHLAYRSAAGTERFEAQIANPIATVTSVASGAGANK
ncbi:putative Lipoprotein [Pararobbsia alpina]|uniref:hypothetical protein n=1 Tax=Pararobbsia alpina TaxID=621374 RepID=UPI0039A46431